MARAFVAELCARWDFLEQCDDIVLPVSELVANAVLHARSAAVLTVSLSEGMIEVAVHDDSARKPLVRPSGTDLAVDLQLRIARAEDEPLDLRLGGRGMVIVDAIADEWGVQHLAEGKDVWFRLRAPAAPDYACPCPGSDRFTPGGMPLRPR